MCGSYNIKHKTIEREKKKDNINRFKFSAYIFQTNIYLFYLYSPECNDAYIMHFVLNDATSKNIATGGHMQLVPLLK